MVTVNQALGSFLTQLAADGRSKHSIAQVRRHVLSLSRWLEAQGASDDVDKLTAGQVASFLASPAALCKADGSTKRVSSSNAMRTSLRCFGRFVHDAGLASANPARLVRRARASPPPPKPISDGDLGRLLAAMSADNSLAARRDFVLFSTLSACGIRVGSAVAARVEDLDLGDGVLTIRTAKGGTQGRVYLRRDLVDLLRNYLQGRASGALFRAAHGGALNTRTIAFRLDLWAKRAGVAGKASPHRLRHSFGTRLLERTGDLAIVQRALLHKSIASTMNYVHVADDRLRAAVGG